MNPAVYVDHYLDGKRSQRREVFQAAASASLLMSVVILLYRHFYHLFDAFCRWFLLVRLRIKPPKNAEAVQRSLGKLYADAIDCYHLLWVFVTFGCYSLGWFAYNQEEETWTVYWLWALPMALCVYRIFEIFAALIEIYFRTSTFQHHQFRILLHTFLHYLATGISFALFFLFADWKFESFTTRNRAGEPTSSFEEFFEPIYHSLHTLGYFGGADEPQEWVGKLLMLAEMMIAFVLATFIFLNITQLWLPEDKKKH